MISPRSHIRRLVRSFLRSFQMEIEFNSHTMLTQKPNLNFKLTLRRYDSTTMHTYQSKNLLCYVVHQVSRRNLDDSFGIYANSIVMHFSGATFFHRKHNLETIEMHRTDIVNCRQPQR